MDLLEGSLARSALLPRNPLCPYHAMLRRSAVRTMISLPWWMVHHISVGFCTRQLPDELLELRVHFRQCLVTNKHLHPKPSFLQIWRCLSDAQDEFLHPSGASLLDFQLSSGIVS
jgi:hypothetical protein